MPHTSHKKKKQHLPQCLSPLNKRGEVKSDDGWIHIARSGKTVSIKDLNLTSNTGMLTSRPPDDPTYDEDLDEGFTRMTFHYEQPELPEGASLEKALSQYHRCEIVWKQSNSWAELKKTFDSQISSQDLAITDCICFGLSTPTGLIQPVADRRNVSMYQLAAFKSVIDILTEKQGERPQAFAQEPRFNTLDKHLLAHLDITVVDHPAAFHLLTPTTFAFCPCAEQFVVRGTLSRSPASYLGSGALETYRDPQTGHLRSPHIGTIFLESDDDNQFLIDPQDITEKDANKQHDPQVFQTSRARQKEKADLDAVRGAGILHRFKQGKQVFRLPDLDGPDHPFRDMHLFWRSATAVEANKKDEG
jgi:SRR1